MGKYFDPQITIGNILVLISLAVGGIVTISELRASDQVTATRIAVLEEKAKKAEESREILIEVREAMKSVQAQLNRINR